MSKDSTNRYREKATAILATHDSRVRGGRGVTRVELPELLDKFAKETNPSRLIDLERKVLRKIPHLPFLSAEVVLKLLFNKPISNTKRKFVVSNVKKIFVLERTHLKDELISRYLKCRDLEERDWIESFLVTLFKSSSHIGLASLQVTQLIAELERVSPSAPYESSILRLFNSGVAQDKQVQKLYPVYVARLRHPDSKVRELIEAGRSTIANRIRFFPFNNRATAKHLKEALQDPNVREVALKWEAKYSNGSAELLSKPKDSIPFSEIFENYLEAKDNASLESIESLLLSAKRTNWSEYPQNTYRLLLQSSFNRKVLFLINNFNKMGLKDAQKSRFIFFLQVLPSLKLDPLISHLLSFVRKQLYHLTPEKKQVESAILELLSELKLSSSRSEKSALQMILTLLEYHGMNEALEKKELRHIFNNLSHVDNEELADIFMARYPPQVSPPEKKEPLLPKTIPVPNNFVSEYRRADETTKKRLLAKKLSTSITDFGTAYDFFQAIIKEDPFAENWLNEQADTDGPPGRMAWNLLAPPTKKVDTPSPAEVVTCEKLLTEEGE